MEFDELLKLCSPYQGEAFRNICTVSPSQDLFDDILDLEEAETAHAWSAKTSAITANNALYHRPFQYGEIDSTLFVFEDFAPTPTRFSDGSYGVWYGALDEYTSLIETCHWLQSDIQANLPYAKNNKIRLHRRMFRANLKHDKTIDLVSQQKIFPDLVHTSDYDFCNSLGEFSRLNQIGLYQSPSARNTSGVCVPVFDPRALKSDLVLYDYYLTFELDSNKIIYEKNGIQKEIILT